MSELILRLQAMREDLRAQVTADRAILTRPLDDKGEDVTVSQHPADVASDLQAREELVAEEQRLVGELAEVEDALARIASGSYGICVECGRPIARARLVARPQAARCITCQRRADRRRQR